MQKYFISDANFDDRLITGDDAFHIKNVMRNKIGDKILVSCQSQTYLAQIFKIAEGKITFEIIEKVIGNHELPVFISIYQGYPKGDKLEDIIKHGTELGASEFIPIIMKRSLFKLDPKKKESKLVRFNKIAKEAAEQSYRDIVPVVKDIIELNKVDFSSYNYKILCYEEASKNNELVNFKNTITKLKPKDRVAIVIGPEGGVDPLEAEYLQKNGFILCSLGSRILRTETVVFYCLSAIGYELELTCTK